MIEPTFDIQGYLKKIRRLGIKYVSLKKETPSEYLDASHVLEKKEDLKFIKPESKTALSSVEPGSLSALGTQHSNLPKWLMASQETVQAMELMAFYNDINQCQNCPLGSTRKSFVFGSGDPQAKVMFIGEAPGADEDEQGLPFVGRAGQLLTKIIESTQTWKRQEVFICNVLKCRPPGNRTPLPEEVEACRPYLEEQIHVIRPKLIMALGASAVQALLRTKDSVGKLRGRWHDYQGVPLRVTYHPAALLRFDGYKKDVWQDMKEFTAKYKELEDLS